MPRGVYPRTARHRAINAANLEGHMKRFEDPAFREEWAERARRRYKENPALREKIVEGNHRRYRDPEEHLKLSRAHHKGAEVGYDGAHYRARKALKEDRCVLEGQDCSAWLECAFRYDAPVEFVRYTRAGQPYYVGPDVRDGYQRLCRTHHKRYDRDASAQDRAPGQGGPVT